jgi:transposase-like protein
MRKKRHNYTPEEKVSILRRHLVEHLPVSDLCDKHQLQPTIFYHWQKQFFENGAAAFTREDRPQKRVEEFRIQQLEAKLVRKHEVLSELMEKCNAEWKGTENAFS